MSNIQVKPKSTFNPEQRQAIEADSKHDILISAGAGSGKTSTLTERVFRLIESGDIKPSELLVLTFTNNAAHEMKERIIARFKKANSPLAEQMPSAHIQTFDSFSQYLVSTYAGRLGISNQISVANESVINAKKAEILDAVLMRYYEDPELKKRLLNTLIKFDTRDDNRLKKIIVDIDRQLEKMLPSDRRDFIDNYDERYLSEDSYARFMGAYLKKQKDAIIFALFHAFFIETYFDGVTNGPVDPKKMKEAFEDKAFFTRDYRTFNFSDPVYCQPLYEAILDVLEKEGGEFIEAVKLFPSLHEDILKSVKASALGGLSDEEKAKIKAVWTPMRFLFMTDKAVLSDLMSLDNDDAENHGLILSFKEDIHLLLEIVEEMEKALFDYKKSISAFTFADISVLALKLVTEPEFADVAKEIRGRFKYIMVDEYQDTNDFQETFINSLLQPDEQGNRAHLFCVGDAKQSIYAFRNSNVALFRARQAAYEKDKDAEVIHMNRNYRSGKQLLKEINAIFTYYMSLDHGSIDYKDEKEQLRYDDDANPYNLPYPAFGIYRVVPDGEVKSNEQAQWEAHVIIKMIKEMVGRYDVYSLKEKGEKIRKCDYKDFAILTRKKAKFGLYQKLFAEAGIPLNISVSTNLREIDAIILLQSLISLIAWKKFGLKADVKHLFASVARSYAYQYTDEQIYDLLSYKAPAGEDEDNPNRDLALILKDPIMQTVEKFCQSHWDSSFNTIFLDLLSTFHVIERLYLIGGVDENIAKIESLHQMVLAEEKAGEGLPEFVRLFQSIKKYSLDLNVDSDFDVDNAVTLMTIHASKGLEQKIILMPASLTSLGKENGLTKPDYDFSKEYGILLPNYLIPEEGAAPTYSIPYRLYREEKKKHNPEEDEHVRLLYVALTRAQNAIYIVGDDPQTEGSLYEMLDYMPHYITFHDDLIKEKLASGVVDQALYDRYQELVKFIYDDPLPLTVQDLGKERYDIYSSLAGAYYTGKTNDEVSEILTKIELQLYLHYLGSAQHHKGDMDFYARLYGAFRMPDAHIMNFADLCQAISASCEEEEDEDEEAVDESDIIDEKPVSGLLASNEATPNKQLPDKREPDVPTINQIHEFVANFGNAALTEDYAVFGIDEIKGKTDEELERKTHLAMADQLLEAYASALDGYGYVFKTSYASVLYPDHTLEYHWSEEEAESIIPSPTIDDLDPKQINDDDIPFVIRQKKRASKSAPVDDDTPIREILDRGIYLHRLMELMDWNTRDVSYIPDPKDRKLVEDVLSLSLFQDSKDDKYLAEYGYYDVDLKTVGFIDLLIAHKDGTYSIIDWKTKDIEDSAYEGQLHTYQRNVQRLFKVSKDKIKLFLVSLLDKKAKPVATE